MAVTSDSFGGVDLSRLPAPDIIEPLDFETILAQALAQFKTYFPSFNAMLESEPVCMLIQLFCFRELLLRQRVNEAGRAVMPAYALGGDLDHLAATVGVERFILTLGNPALDIPPVYESDEDLRRRMVLAPEGFSVAGPEGAYVFHALSAHSDVLDASAVSPEPDDIKALVLSVLDDHDAGPALVTAMQSALDGASWPGMVMVTTLSRTGDGTPDPDVLAAVDTKLSDKSIRPLTDHVTVQAADVVHFAIVAALTFLSGPDRSLVMAEAQKRLNEYLAITRRLGRDVTRAGIIAALHPEGVQNINLISPAADIVLTRVQASFCTGITLTDEGVGE